MYGSRTAILRRRESKISEKQKLKLFPSESDPRSPWDEKSESGTVLCVRAVISNNNLFSKPENVIVFIGTECSSVSVLFVSMTYEREEMGKERVEEIREEIR